MTRTFIQTKEFSKNWENLGYSDEDLRKLELEIMRNPKAGEVIPETGRLRKLRFSVTAKGKRGGARVCYVDFLVYETIYLITVYAKNEKDNLSMRECHNIRNMISLLEKNLEAEVVNYE